MGDAALLEAATVVADPSDTKAFGPPFAGLGADGLVCNFDQELVAVFSEAKQWDKFQGRYSTPSIIHDIMFQQEKLHLLQQKVLQVVRAYNNILADMDQGERKLFHDKLRALDRQINGEFMRGATRGVLGAGG